MAPQEGGGVCKRRDRSGGPGTRTGLLSLGFYLTCDQVYAVIRVTKKGFDGGGCQYF